MAAIRGILFDKDGTLFDFEASWSAWAASMLSELAAGDLMRAAALGRRIGFDFDRRRFDPASPVIAGTPQESAALLLPGLEGWDAESLVSEMNRRAAAAPLVEAVPLGPLLAELRAMGLALGVATNDAEAPARAHLQSAGQAGAFDFVAGYDSGHGAKPGPGMCLAFADTVRLAPGAVVMVGDSPHDIEAGRADGMATVAVLTGMAGAADLTPLADAVLPDIGGLPGWIRAGGAG